MAVSDPPSGSPQSGSEEDRLAALLELDILDTPEEQEFDELVRLASEICATPISTVTFVDKDRQWFKASVGLADKETPRSVSFCSHAIQKPGLFVIEDANDDGRFKSNLLVTGKPGIRFYAGVPLQAPNGIAVGTLCVIDTMPRTLSENQKNALLILGRQVQARMELRARQKALERALQEKVDLTRKLESTTVLFETFVNHNPNYCFFKSEDGRYLSYNTKFAEFFGIDLTAWIGKTDHEVLPEARADSHRARDLLVLGRGIVSDILVPMTDQNGNAVWHKSIKFPIPTAEGSSILAGIVVDVTREVEKEQALLLANEQLERLARTDALTGLSNRRVFEERIAAEFSAAARKGRSLSLLMLDIDDFKKRNDTYGHAAGDEALRVLARVLQAGVRLEDVAARVGGEEFAVLLPDTNIAAAKLVTERLQMRLSQADSGPTPLTVSVGIASAKLSSENWEGLVTRADDALYQAKRYGKNRFAISE